MTKVAINHATIMLENNVLFGASLLIEDGKIAKISQSPFLNPSKGTQVITPDAGCTLMPGRIDLHIHGTNNCDVMDATPQALSKISESLAREGTTSFLATTMTMSIDSIEAAMINVAKCMLLQNMRGAQPLGLHLEGPFISPLKAGAHNSKDILVPSIELIQRWQELSSQNIRMVTLAPEVKGAAELIAYLRKNDIIPSLGHSEADYQQAKIGISQGCCHATHLYNAMTGLHHRTPGAALAILESDIIAELIADGLHVSPEMLRFTLQVKGRNQLCLVTDSIRAKCMGEGIFDLGGQEVTVSDKQARLANGCLAGSILSMDEACRNMLDFTACDLNDLMYMTSINPAKQLGIFSQKGSIAVGKDADLILLDHKCDVKLTLCSGEVAFSDL